MVGHQGFLGYDVPLARQDFRALVPALTCFGLGPHFSNSLFEGIRTECSLMYS